MLHLVLVDTRNLARTHGEQISDLADAFHNLPYEMNYDFFSFSFFREAFLVPYYRKWPEEIHRNYLGMFDEIQKLER